MGRDRVSVQEGEKHSEMDAGESCRAIGRAKRHWTAQFNMVEIVCLYYVTFTTNLFFLISGKMDQITVVD